MVMAKRRAKCAQPLAPRCACTWPQPWRCARRAPACPLRSPDLTRIRHTHTGPSIDQVDRAPSERCGRTRSLATVMVQRVVTSVFGSRLPTRTALCSQRSTRPRAHRHSHLYSSPSAQLISWSTHVPPPRPSGSCGLLRTPWKCCPGEGTCPTWTPWVDSRPSV
jgi:hypothetical protein